MWPSKTTLVLAAPTVPWCSSAFNGAKRHANSPTRAIPGGAFSLVASGHLVVFRNVCLECACTVVGNAAGSCVFDRTLLLVCAMAWALNRYLNKVCKTSGYLLWDEGCWQYVHDGQVGGIEHLTVLWDAGDRIWLRWSSLMPGSRRSWSEAWLLKRDAPERWHLLRCAVAAHSGKNFTQPSH